MRVGIINIGDELLSGKIVNTNQFDLARMLIPLGHDIPFNLVIGDEEDALARTLEWVAGPGCFFRPELLILTGGLGPTRDDRTRNAVAGYLGRPVIEHPDALGWLRGFLRLDASAELAWGQRVQAAVPDGSDPLRNPAGTACGFRFQVGDIPACAFPGVPAELDAMVRLHLLPELQADQVLLERTLWTWGWSEGAQRQAFAGLDFPDAFRFSSLPGIKGVRLTLSCLCAPSHREDYAARLEVIWGEMIRAIPAEAIIDTEGHPLPEAVLKLLSGQGATVSVAESCTGGGLGFLLTETSGSSAVFQRGFLTYSDPAKTDLLGVAPEILERHGAVSEETALAMVKGCLERSGASYAVAITGIAGPNGGTPEKPVGSVWIGVASERFAVARLFKFRGDRNTIRWRSAYTALNQLRLLLSGKLQ